MNAPEPQRLPIGRMLLAQGVISEDQLRIALHEQGRSARPIGRLLVDLGFVSEAALRDALGESRGQQTIDLTRAVVEAAALELVPRELAGHCRAMPVAYRAEARQLLVAVADPDDIVAIDRLRARLPHGLTIETAVAAESEIARAIDRYYGHTLSIDGILREIETGEVDHRSLVRPHGEYAQPVVRLVDALLTDAVHRNASDIHFEPEAGFLRIRYRIDGILRQVRALHKSYWPAMAVRIKVVSGMNIAEARAPQDGRFSLAIGGRAIDFRAAALPTLHGENIVLRVLDRHQGIVPLDGLGLDDEQLGQLRRLLARPEGLLLVTGPTGSGKTTTLYSILSHINAESINVMTLEDPVEYPMAMVRQTAVAEAARLDFADGIRAIMRQDPDAILVGEIRDADTAAMAFRAAMTGHRVFSTLHTQSAAGAFPRLFDIGVPPDIIAGNVIGVIAQRLVRRLCPHCREAVVADECDCRLLGVEVAAAPTIYRAVGCERCGFQGYRGRLALMELLRVDADIDELVARRATTREIRQAALARGFRPLAAEAARGVLDGSTSLAEAMRVVDLTERMA